MNNKIEKELLLLQEGLLQMKIFAFVIVMLSLPLLLGTQTQESLKLQQIDYEMSCPEDYTTLIDSK